MKALVIAAMFGAGCSSLLGITDPKIAGDDDTHPDAPVDAHVESGDHLEISLSDFSLATQQAVHLHVRLVHKDDSSVDVTSQATWSSDTTAIATAQSGEVDGVSEGTATITTSLGDATPASVHASVTATFCHLMINEVQAGGNASASDEWVEIINPCTTAIVVDAFTLVYRAASAIGSTDTNVMVTLAGTVDPGTIQLFAGNGFGGTKDGGWATGFMQANNGAVGIRDDLGTLIDSVAYGTVTAGHPFVEGTAAPALANDMSIARLPFDGNDTDTGGSDFVLQPVPTPRAANVP